MLGVIRQVSGLKNADNSINQEAVAAVRREIQGLSAELPLATTEIMQMYEAGARMDVPRQELAAYVRTAAEAATAFDAQDMGALQKISAASTKTLSSPPSKARARRCDQLSR